MSGLTKRCGGCTKFLSQQGSLAVSPTLLAQKVATCASFSVVVTTMWPMPQKVATFCYKLFAVTTKLGVHFTLKEL